MIYLMVYIINDYENDSMRFFLWNNPFNFELSMIGPGNHGPKSRSARTSEICENADRGAPWIPRLSLQKNQTNTVYLKWGASFWWSYGLKSACSSIETMTIGKTRSSLLLYSNDSKIISRFKLHLCIFSRLIQDIQIKCLKNFIKFLIYCTS